MAAERKNQVPIERCSFAQEQRSIQTLTEDLFWSQVRAGRFHGYKFKRQVPITPYIVDFLCASARLIVELDGPPHENEEQRAHDLRRDTFLRQQNFRVLRFTNDAFLGNPQVVMDQVLQAIERAKTLPPLRGRGRGATLLASAPLPSAGEGGPRVGEGRERGGPREHGPSPAPLRGAPSPAEGRGE